MNRDSSDEYVERAIQKSMERFKREVALLAEINAEITKLTATDKGDYYKAQDQPRKIEQPMTY